MNSHDEPQPLPPGEPASLDVEIWPTCIVVPARYRIGITIRGRDDEYDGVSATLSDIRNVMRGCGPFLHDDPDDRPPAIFGRTYTLHFSAEDPPYVLLPIIPAKEASASS